MLGRSKAKHHGKMLISLNVQEGRDARARPSWLAEGCIYTGGFLPTSVAFRIRASTCSGEDNHLLASAWNKPKLRHISTYHLCALKVFSRAQMLFASCWSSLSRVSRGDPSSTQLTWKSWKYRYTSVSKKLPWLGGCKFLWTNLKEIPME